MERVNRIVNTVVLVSFILLILSSGNKVGYAINTSNAKNDINNALKYITIAEKVTSTNGFDVKEAQKQLALSTKAVFKVKGYGKSYYPTYEKLNKRVTAVKKKIEARLQAESKRIEGQRAKVIAAEKAVASVEASAKAIKGDSDSEAAYNLYKKAYTAAMELLKNLDRESSEYKGLAVRMVQIDNNVKTKMNEGTKPIVTPIPEEPETLVKSLSDTGVITFADALLEAEIRKTIPKSTGDIMLSDAEKITRLFVEEKGITNLSGLENFTNLTELYLSNNKICSIKPLEKLTKLTVLDLARNELRKVDALKEMNQLKNLMIYSNKISDVEPLRRLVSLRELSLGYNEISNVEPLKSLYKLTHLSLGNNKISSLEPLQQLSNLYYLEASSNQISSIEPLRNLVKLNELWLSNNQVSNLEPLNGSQNLYKLVLYNNKVENVKPLSGLNKLRILLMKGNPANDFTPLSTIYANIMEKDFVVPGIVDAIVKFADTNLENAVREQLKKPTGDIYKSEVIKIIYFSAGYRNITNLAGIEALTSLKNLDLSSNKIQSLEPLRGLLTLEQLNLDSNQISDIAPVEALSGLKGLQLSKNRVRSLEPLRRLTDLGMLDLYHNRVENIDALMDMKAMTYLSLLDNPVENIEPLRNMVHLATLNLADCPIVDFSPLSNLYEISWFSWGGFSNLKDAEAFLQKAKAIVDEIIEPGMSEFDKELTIHDYIVSHTKYDYQNYLSNTIPVESYTAYGVLCKGTAVCEGYSDATSLLLSLAGVKSYRVVGKANGAKGWEDHAWNIVRIDGFYYHLDTTWDDPVSDQDIKRYTYFNLTDQWMNVDHQFEIGPYPACIDYKFSYLNKRQ